MFRPALLILSGWLLLSGCSPALRCPARGGPAWHELTSAHFRIQGNLPLRELRDHARSFEEDHDALTHFAFRARREPPRERVEVVLLGTEDEYQALGPKNTAGTFRPGWMELDGTPTILLFGDYDNNVRRIFLHELVHRLIAHYIPSAPRWVHEGMATYFETMRVADGKVRFGAPPEYLIPVLREHGGVWPSLRELLSVERDVFRADQPTYYASAWALVHMLLHNPGDHDRFDAYLFGLAEGKRPEPAWEAAFGDLGAALSGRYRSYLTGSLEEFEGDYRPGPVPPSEVRVLPTAEVHLLWARLRMGGEEADRDQKVVDDLLEAQKEDPRSPESRYLMGSYLGRRREHLAEAERLLREAIALRPREGRYWHRLYLVIERAAGADPSVAAWQAAVAVLGRLVEFGRSAGELATLARHFARTGEPDRGLAFARRAAEADPGCWSCLDVLAALLYEKQWPSEALRVQERAVNLLPEGRSSPAMTERLRRYRQATWAQMKEHFSTPTPGASPP